MRPSDRLVSTQPNWLIIGSSASRRTQFLLQSLHRRSQRNIHLLSLLDVVSAWGAFAQLLETITVLRMEALAEEMEGRHLLLRLGEEAARAEGSPVALPRELNEELSEGNYAHPMWSRQVYLGMKCLLHSIDDATRCLPLLSFHSTPDMLLMFDKYNCQNYLLKNQITVPGILSKPCDYVDVREVVRNERRCFLKTAHGSGASGCMALHSNGQMVRGLTPLCFTSYRGLEWLYCATSTKSICDEMTLSKIVDRLCQEGCHLERWLPKARFSGLNFDMRVVCIGGEPLHTIIRLSSGPFTNLNLGNRRLAVDAFRDQASHRLREGLDRAVDLCRRCSQLFPHSMSIGFDVLIDPRGTPYILEANPLGDLLPGTLCRGLDTYTTEIDFALGKWKALGIAKSPNL